MSVVISNTSTHDDLEGENSYEVRIGGRLIAGFSHVRRDGLADCLRRAAEAVDLAEPAGYQPGRPRPKEG